VASFNRPGGNVTGISSMNVEVAAKRFGLLHELLPRAERFAALVSPNSTTTSLIAELQAAALSVGREIEFFTAANNREIETAFAAAVKKRVDGLLVGNVPPLVEH
jgi:putative ABC transport system substrate-binding protein